MAYYVALYLRTYGEISPRVDLIFPDHLLLENFQGDQLSVILFIGFYFPTFRVVPVWGLAVVVQVDVDEMQTMCVRPDHPQASSAEFYGPYSHTRT